MLLMITPKDDFDASDDADGSIMVMTFRRRRAIRMMVAVVVMMMKMMMIPKKQNKNEQTNKHHLTHQVDRFSAVCHFIVSIFILLLQSTPTFHSGSFFDGLICKQNI